MKILNPPFSNLSHGYSNDFFLLKVICANFYGIRSVMPGLKKLAIATMAVISISCGQEACIQPRDPALATCVNLCLGQETHGQRPARS